MGISVWYPYSDIYLDLHSFCIDSYQDIISSNTLRLVARADSGNLDNIYSKYLYGFNPLAFAVSNKVLKYILV